MSGSAPFLGEINENAGAHLKKATTAENSLSVGGGAGGG